MLDKISTRRRALLAACLVGALGTAATAQAPTADYPNRPIHLIVGFAPGGSTDVLARIVANKLSERLGQQVVVENRPGASGNIATVMAARSAPDGYTLLISSSALVVNPSLFAEVRYDPIKDFAPISYIASAPSLLVVNPGVKATTVQELVGLVKAAPGKYNYSSPGAGTAQHLAGELFKITTSTDLQHIPFSGAGPAVSAVLAGQVQTSFASLPAVLPHVNAGTLRALAITSTVRSPAAPDIPTFAEAGFPAVESDHLQGLLAPAGTPKPIVDRLSREVASIIQLPDVRKQLVDLGFVLVGDTPEQFAEIIKFQVGKWRKVITEANIKVD